MLSTALLGLAGASISEQNMPVLSGAEQGLAWRSFAGPSIAELSRASQCLAGLGMA